MNMIERVARAIAGSAASAFGDRAIHYVENNWGAYTNQARAAILSLREPTHMMLVRGSEQGNGPEPYQKSEKSLLDCWRDMIDAALKED